jgi:hypothetical protein
VAGGGGANSILHFQLEMRGDGTKRSQKMKQSQRAHVGSMGSKRDTACRHGDVGRRRGSTGEGKGGDHASWANATLTRPNMKKIHAVDSTATNGR